MKVMWGSLTGLIIGLSFIGLGIWQGYENGFGWGEYLFMGFGAAVAFSCMLLLSMEKE